LNPERIVLSGISAKAGKPLPPPIQQAINEFCIAERVEIKLASIADKAELLGAASLVINGALFE
jgi:predicted NBD/HSP70 family sugar kinase